MQVNSAGYDVPITTEVSLVGVTTAHLLIKRPTWSVTPDVLDIVATGSDIDPPTSTVIWHVLPGQLDRVGMYEIQLEIEQDITTVYSEPSYFYVAPNAR